MLRGQSIIFRPFHLDAGNERLWRGSRVISLRPKAFAVLRYLVEHADQLVTKEELLDAVWPDTAVSDVVPIVCVRELRQALGDRPEAPQFIETVPRRGYRFIAQTTPVPLVPSAKFPIPGSKPQNRKTRSKSTLSPQPPAFSIVGRAGELGYLQSLLEKAQQAKRQTVFITGESGIGKTAMVEAFLDQATASRHLWGRGQCLEHYGAGEAYLPVLDAFTRLCRERGGEHVIEILARHAPTWLVQMPALISAADLEVLQRKILGTTRERMLREMAEAVEALTAEAPLILVLEDLHWSDHSTLDLIAYLAQRREPARLLLIGTYRPAELLMTAHPLKAVTQELLTHRRCEELPLGLLSEAAVAEYLRLRFSAEAHNPVPLQELAQVLHWHTDGNPFFLVNVVDYLVAQGLVEKLDGQDTLVGQLAEMVVGMPESIRRMIEKQIDRLSPAEQHTLEAASVAGAEFSTAAVAAGFVSAELPVEELCEGLARREQFLRVAGIEEWPDGTVAACYRFIHPLYQHGLYGRVSPLRRMRLHQRIGERKETGYGARAGEIAAELAMHFARGKDYRRAVQYLRHAAENAVRRYAFREAIEHFTKGLELLHYWPDTQERTQQELSFYISVIGPLMALKGEAAPEVACAHAQMEELRLQLGETSRPLWALLGLWVMHLMRGEFRTAQELAEQLMAQARQEESPLSLLWANHALGVTLFHQGEFVAARMYLERELALFHTQQHPRYMADPQMICLFFLAVILLFFGYPEQALRKSKEALALARQCSHPYGLAFALSGAAWFHINRREGLAAQAYAEELMTLAQKHGFAASLAIGTALQGGSLAEQGQWERGSALIRQGLAAWQATGAGLGVLPWLITLAALPRESQGVQDGLTMLAEAEAAMQWSGERLFEAELYRVKGELLLQKFPVSSSEFRVVDPQPPSPG